MPLVAPFLVGVIAILALMAAYYFAQGITDALRKLPFFGNALANIAASVMADIIQYLMGLWAMSARIMNAVFVAPVTMFLGMMNATASLATETAHGAFWIANTLVQHVWDELVARIESAVTAAERYAAREVATARHALAAAITAARSYAHGLVATLHHTLDVAIHDTRLYAAHLVTSAIHGAGGVLSTLERYADNVVHAARVDLTKSINAAEAAAAAGVAKAIGYTDTQVGKAIHTAETTAVTAAGVLVTDLDHAAAAAVGAVWPGVIGAVDELSDVLGSDLADIGQAVRAIPRAVPTDLAAALAGVTALAIPAVRYMRDCGVPNCRNLSAVGRELQGLFGLVEGVAFLGVLGELVHDPAGAARMVQDDLGGIVDDTASAARQLLGV